MIYVFENSRLLSSQGCQRNRRAAGREFAIPVHSLIRDEVPADKTTITCKSRVWKGFRWSQLGRGAEIKLKGKVLTGPRGGSYFVCLAVDILKGVPVSGPRLPKSIIRKLEKEYATT